MSEHDNWMKSAEIYRSYFNRYKKNPPSGTIRKGVNISRWLNINEREFERGELSDEYVSILNSINPEWYILNSKFNNIWLKRYNELVEYMKKDPSLDMLKYEKGLYRWLREQRYKNNKSGLKGFRREYLERLNVRWYELTKKNPNEIEYNNRKYRNIPDLCNKLNMDVGIYRKIYYENNKDIDKSIQLYKNLTVEERKKYDKYRKIADKEEVERELVGESEEPIDIYVARKSLKEMAESLNIDYKGLVENVNYMSLEKAIKFGKMEKYKESEEYINELIRYIEDVGSKHGLNRNIPNTVRSLEGRCAKIKMLNDIDVRHANNIKRIAELVDILGKKNDVVYYLLEKHKGYERAESYSEDLLRILDKIYRERQIGQDKYYNKIAKSMCVDKQVRINNIERFLKEPDRIIFRVLKLKRPNLLKRYRGSYYNTVKMERFIEKVADNKRVEALKLMVKLEKKFKLNHRDLVYSDLDGKNEIIDIINNSGITVRQIMEYTIKNGNKLGYKVSKQLQMEEIMEKYIIDANRTIVDGIGRFYKDIGEVKNHGTLKRTALRAMANVALKMINEEVG